MDARRIKDVDNFIALYGHKKLNLYEVDDDVLKVMKEIVELDIPEFNGVNLTYISKRKMKHDAMKFYASKVILRDVGYLGDKQLIYLLRHSIISSLDDLVKLYNSAGVFVSPFAIPITYSKEKVFAGTIETQLLITDDDSIDGILEKMNVYFNNVFLPKRVTPVATSCYIHEIMHSQLESQKGIVEDFYNGEVLSIFMEMLSAYERKDKTYYMILSLRINHLCASFNSMYLYQNDQIKDPRYTQFEFCKDGKYFISILKAFNLLEKYINGSYSDKKRIFIQMQNVICGDRTVEDMLQKLDVTYESSLDSDITNRLLKV